ncbi:palmitoyltransferase [Asterophora parasitica]|uniref:Synaptobrevin homolog YKT6 n=1 Tax=Asterophora parasitica TaxID=117018 RepID=A0A9P7GEP7_9AGAR|nr:palmitoyltransferase [Asterophora parasitica]
MKIFSISVILAPPSGTSVVLSNASDLSSFSFYQKGSVGEFMSFFSKTVAERTPQGQRQSVQENTYTAHVYNRGGAEQLAAVIITDQEYPVRPAFSLLTKLLDEFTAKVPQSSFENPAAISFQDINTYIQKYQDPRQADTIMRVQQELDETKIVLHKTIESVLQRGEKLDNLVDRSNALSAQSKMFYKTAKKNRHSISFRRSPRNLHILSYSAVLHTPN